MTKEESVNETFARISEKADSVDLLVNAVGGLGGRHEITDMPTEFMRKVMALNFDSVFFVTRACLPLLKKGTNPSIVNFSTIAVTSGGGPGAAIYSASKGAVQSYTRGLAKDLVQFGIRVNAVSPGTIDTPSMRQLPGNWWKVGRPVSPWDGWEKPPRWPQSLNSWPAPTPLTLPAK